MMSGRAITAFALSLALLSCSGTSNVQTATNHAEQLLDALDSGDTTRIEAFYGDTFFQVTPRADFLGHLGAVMDEYGEIQGYDAVTTRLLMPVGADRHSIVVVVYDVEHERGLLRHKMTVGVDGKDSAWIIGHDIQDLSLKRP